MMLAFKFVWMAGATLVVAFAIREMLVWLHNRRVQRRQMVNERLRNEYYAGLKEALLQHIDKVLREVEEP